MRTAEWINLVFFSLLIALGWLWRLGRDRLVGVAAIGAVGIGLTLAGKFLQEFLSPVAASVVRDWLPAPLMLMVYWQAGRFYRKPNQKLQWKLGRLDEKVLGAIQRSWVNQWSHTWAGGYLELAYLFCYALVPLGVAVLYLLRLGRHADEYWALVLPSAYLCYGATAIVQTLPPRMLASEEGASARPSRIRALNLWILRHASIQANTFPSAHVAATMAASLALLRFAPAVGLIFLWVSLSIAAGAVVGRYHYLADALIAVALTTAIFLLETFAFR